MEERNENKPEVGQPVVMLSKGANIKAIMDEAGKVGLPVIVDTEGIVEEVEKQKVEQRRSQSKVAEMIALAAAMAPRDSFRRGNRGFNLGDGFYRLLNFKRVKGKWRVRQ